MDIEQAPSFSIPQLRTRRGSKWHRHGAEVLPCWVAEMDFPVAPPIQAALQRILRDQEYGYAMRDGDNADLAVCRAFARRMQSRFGWTVDPDDVWACSDLVQTTFASVLAFSEPGDKVALQTPAYPPFREAILSIHRRLLPVPARDDGNRYVFDLDRLAEAIDAHTRMILLCHPQNPTGRVLGRTELEAFGQLAIERDLVIVSDEIHADLVHPGHRHIPIASISPAIAARTITMTSATKSFNIPGLRCGVIHFGSPALQARMQARVPHRLLGHPSIAGIDATVAAWDEGQLWLDSVLAGLTARREQLSETLRRELPQLHFHPPEATYLAWIDCAALQLGMPAAQFFLERAGIAASPGENFEPGGTDFLRLNFATSAEILDEILTRMVRAVRANSHS